MTVQRSKILTLLVRFGTSKYPTAVDDIEHMFAAQLPEFEHRIVVIDNALAEDHLEVLGPRVTVIGGNNALWEFSAWDRGLEYVRETLDTYAFVNLATSAFRELYTGFLDAIDGDMLRLVAGRAAAVGHIDHFNGPVGVVGRSLQSWLRSSFVLLPPAELGLLRSMVGIADGASLFSGDPAAPFRADAPITDSYRQNIIGWLTGGGTGQGTTWHSRFDLTEQTLPFFEAKTMAILNEQLLTSRLRAQGCAVVDATWLAAVADMTVPSAWPLRVIPGWRTQIQQRGGQ